MRVGIGILLIIAAVAYLLFSLIPAITDDNQAILDIFEPIYCGSGEQLSAERVVGPGQDGGISMTAYYTCMRADETSYDVTGKSWIIMGGGFVILLLLGIGFLIVGRRTPETEVYIDPLGLDRTYGSQVARGTRVVTVNISGAPASEYSFDASASPPVSAPDDIFNLPVDNKATMMSIPKPASSDAPEDIFNLPIDNKATMISKSSTNFPLVDNTPTMMSKPPTSAQQESPQIDLQEKLRQLEEAYDHHLINREEFERKRDEILSEF